MPPEPYAFEISAKEQFRDELATLQQRGSAIEQQDLLALGSLQLQELGIGLINLLGTIPGVELSQITRQEMRATSVRTASSTEVGAYLAREKSSSIVASVCFPQTDSDVLAIVLERESNNTKIHCQLNLTRNGELLGGEFGSSDKIATSEYLPRGGVQFDSHGQITGYSGDIISETTHPEKLYIARLINFLTTRKDLESRIEPNIFLINAASEINTTPDFMQAIFRFFEQPFLPPIIGAGPDSRFGPPYENQTVQAGRAQQARWSLERYAPQVIPFIEKTQKWTGNPHATVILNSMIDSSGQTGKMPVKQLGDYAWLFVTGLTEENGNIILPHGSKIVNPLDILQITLSEGKLEGGFAPTPYENSLPQGKHVWFAISKSKDPANVAAVAAVDGSWVRLMPSITAMTLDKLNFALGLREITVSQLGDYLRNY